MLASADCDLLNVVCHTHTDTHTPYLTLTLTLTLTVSSSASITTPPPPPPLPLPCLPFKTALGASVVCTLLATHPSTFMPVQPSEYHAKDMLPTSALVDRAITSVCTNWVHSYNGYRKRYGPSHRRCWRWPQMLFGAGPCCRNAILSSFWFPLRTV